MTDSLKQYIEDSILPMYDDISCQREQSRACSSYAECSRDWSEGQFDAAHQRDHVDMVIDSHSVVELKVEQSMEIARQHVEDHRASSDHEPRSIYGNYRASESKDELARSLPSAADRSLKGNIVAEADRYIDPDKIIIRTVQYGLEHYPELDKEGHYKRTVAHMHEKYANGGYLRLWFPESPNAARLEALRTIIRDEQELRNRFNAVYDYFTNPHPQQCDCENCRPKYRK